MRHPPHKSVLLTTAALALLGAAVASADAGTLACTVEYSAVNQRADGFYDGTPTAFGIGLRDHLRALDGR